MPEYKLGNVSFASEEELEMAKKELNTIQIIKSKYDVKDPKIAKAIYDKFVPKTKIGSVFKNQLKNSFDIDDSFLNELEKELGQTKKVANVKASDKKEREVYVPGVTNSANGLAHSIRVSAISYIIMAVILFSFGLVDLIMFIGETIDANALSHTASWGGILYALAPNAVATVCLISAIRKLKSISLFRRDNGYIINYFKNFSYEYIVPAVILIWWIIASCVKKSFVLSMGLYCIAVLAIFFIVDLLSYIRFIIKNKEELHVTKVLTQNAVWVRFEVIGRIVACTLIILLTVILTACRATRKSVDGYLVVLETGSKMTSSESSNLEQLYRELAEDICDDVNVYTKNSKDIYVELPGVSDYSIVEESILRYVNSEIYFIQETSESGEANYTYTGLGKNGYTLTKSIDELAINGSIILTGKDIINANVDSSKDSGQIKYITNINFNENGAEQFYNATTRALARGESLAICLNDEIIATLRVNDVLSADIAIYCDSFETAKERVAFIRGCSVDKGIRIKECKKTKINR